MGFKSSSESTQLKSLIIYHINFNSKPDVKFRSSSQKVIYQQQSFLRSFLTRTIGQDKYVVVLIWITVLFSDAKPIKLLAQNQSLVHKYYKWWNILFTWLEYIIATNLRTLSCVSLLLKKRWSRTLNGMKNFAFAGTKPAGNPERTRYWYCPLGWAIRTHDSLYLARSRSHPYNKNTVNSPFFSNNCFLRLKCSFQYLAVG